MNHPYPGALVWAQKGLCGLHRLLKPGFVEALVFNGGH